MVLADLGVRVDNLKSSLIPYSLLTLIFTASSFVFLKTIGVSLLAFWKLLYPSILFLLVISVLQEIVFRGFLIYWLSKNFKKSLAVIILNAAIFALAHSVFPYREILVPGAFLAGLGFAAVYYYYPNLILVSAAHFITNLVILPYCFFRLISC